MFHIIYVSEASHPLTRQELLALHARAREKNRVVGITGMLIHKEGPIAQREFADWSMGFQDLQDGDLLGLYGHAKPLGKSLNIENFKKNPADCLHLLRFIRDLQLTRG